MTTLVVLHEAWRVQLPVFSNYTDIPLQLFTYGKYKVTAINGHHNLAAMMFKHKVGYDKLDLSKECRLLGCYAVWLL
jgi:hypothetical protein